MKRKDSFFALKTITIFILLGAFIVLAGCSVNYSGLFSMKTQPPDGLISSSKDEESADPASGDKLVEDNSPKDDKSKACTKNSEEENSSNLKDGEKDIKTEDSDRTPGDKPIDKKDEDSDQDKKDPKNPDNKEPENKDDGDDNREPALPVAGIIRQSSNHEAKKVAITFDDGPDGLFTPQILDILNEKEAKATFFVLGCNAKDHKDVLKRIHDEGHALGSHSWSHSDFAKLSKDKQVDELQKSDDLIKEVVGKSDNLFRLPYGSYNDKVLKTVADQGFYNIYWSIDPRDWSGVSSKEILNNLKENIEPGAIILLHCSGSKKSIPNTVKALPNIIDFLRDQGYEIVTIPELLNDQLHE